MRTSDTGCHASWLSFVLLGLATSHDMSFSGGRAARERRIIGAAVLDTQRCIRMAALAALVTLPASCAERLERTLVKFTAAATAGHPATMSTNVYRLGA